VLYKRDVGGFCHTVGLDDEAKILVQGGPNATDQDGLVQDQVVLPEFCGKEPIFDLQSAV
jgi:hypothetical protein